jgi:hypothetical protein
MLPRRLKPSKKGCGFANYLVWDKMLLPLSNSLDYDRSTVVRCIASDNNGVWIMGCGGQDFDKDGVPPVFFRSEDNGATWYEMSKSDAPNAGPPYYSSGLHRHNRNSMATDLKGHWKMIGVDSKSYVSTDNGKTWSEEFDFGASFPDMSPNPTDPDDYNHYQLSTAQLFTDQNGMWFWHHNSNYHFPAWIFRTIDNGANWHEFPYDDLSFGLQHGSLRCDSHGNWYGISQILGPPEPSSGDSFIDVFMCTSRDNCQTWETTLIFPRYTGTLTNANQTNNHSIFDMHASDSGIIIAGFTGKYFSSPGDPPGNTWPNGCIVRSDDFGATWEKRYYDKTNYYGTLVSNILTDGNGFWQATGGGYSGATDQVFSLDDGETWFGGCDGYNGSGGPLVAYGSNRFISADLITAHNAPSKSPGWHDNITQTKQFVSGFGKCNQPAKTDPVEECPVYENYYNPKILFEHFEIDNTDTWSYDDFYINHSKGTWISVGENYSDIYRSTNKGEGWQKIIKPHSRFNPKGVDTDGKGKWIINDYYYSKEMVVSVNDGISWTREELPGIVYRNSNKLVCDRREDQAATWVLNGFSYAKRSNDNGETWSDMTTYKNIVYSGTPENPGRWVAIDSSNGVYYSNDNALTFNKVYTMTTTTSLYYKMEASATGTVVIAMNGLDVFRSTNQGQSWTKLVNGFNLWPMRRHVGFILTDGEGLWLASGSHYANGWHFDSGAMSIDDGLTWVPGPAGYNNQSDSNGYYSSYAQNGEYGEGRFIVGSRPNRCGRSLLP